MATSKSALPKKKQARLIMAEGKIKYGSLKFKKMLSELCKEAAELSIDYKCKVAIFLAPKKIDGKPTMYTFGSPSVASVADELAAKVAKAKAEKRKRKKLMRKINKKAKLEMLEGNSVEPIVPPVCGCEFGGVRVVENANDMSEGI